MALGACFLGKFIVNLVVIVGESKSKEDIAMLFWLTVLSNELVMAIMGMLAYQDTMFWEPPYNMWRPNTPFLKHAAVLGDIFFIPWVLAIAIGYWRKWNPLTVFLALIVGSALSYYANRNWEGMSTRVPNCFAAAGHATTAGYVHYPYFALVVSIVFLFFFCTSGVQRGDALLVSGLLVAHVLLGVVVPAWRVGDLVLSWPIFSPAIYGWVLVAFGYCWQQYLRPTWEAAHY